MECLRLGLPRPALVVLGVLLLGCGQEEKQPAVRFDPKFIASEADKGNLTPLKELNAACSLEVERSAKRGAVCRVQDEVGLLSKPLRPKF